MNEGRQRMKFATKTGTSPEAAYEAVLQLDLIPGVGSGIHEFQHVTGEHIIEVSWETEEQKLAIDKYLNEVSA